MMFDSIAGSVAMFAGTAAVITVCGIRLSDYADQLADKTGWGEALLGGPTGEPTSNTRPPPLATWSRRVFSSCS